MGSLRILVWIHHMENIQADEPVLQPDALHSAHSARMYVFIRSSLQFYSKTTLRNNIFRKLDRCTLLKEQ